MTPISFFANGEPKGQPRPRAFARNFGGKWQARIFNASTAEGWKNQIAVAARPHIPEKPIEGPVRVDLEFTFPRPKCHYRTGSKAGELRNGVPFFHESKPDRDNLDKAVLDCLTTLGFFRDDAQVCAGLIVKWYGPKPGCRITVGTPWVAGVGQANQIGDVYERQAELATNGSGP